MIEVRCASGGSLEVLMRTINNRVSRGGLPMAQVSFRSTERPQEGWSAILTLEVETVEKGDRALVRRKAARGAVTFAKATAVEIRSRLIRPSVNSKIAGAGRFEVVFTKAAHVDGFLRTATASGIIVGTGNRARVAADMPERAALVLEKLAQEIHGAIALPENVEAFGA